MLYTQLLNVFVYFLHFVSLHLSRFTKRPTETKYNSLKMNRNTATKHVPPLNVVDGQSALKLTMAHFTAPQLSNNGCHSGNTMNTMNNFSSTHLSTNCGSGSSPLENLPKKFVSSMRTLFDIMDDKRTGFVRLSDIEARWQDDGSKGLPHGVIGE